MAKLSHIQLKNPPPSPRTCSVLGAVKTVLNQFSWTNNFIVFLLSAWEILIKRPKIVFGAKEEKSPPI